MSSFSLQVSACWHTSCMKRKRNSKRRKAMSMLSILRSVCTSLLSMFATCLCDWTKNND
ncbi:hypothetical protein clg_21 [Corynebacterium phage CL31]|nr:hypothetical protein clg_21 [Corynebacterium phage CL31]